MEVWLMLIVAISSLISLLYIAWIVDKKHVWGFTSWCRIYVDIVSNTSGLGEGLSCTQASSQGTNSLTNANWLVFS